MNSRLVIKRKQKVCCASLVTNSAEQYNKEVCMPKTMICSLCGFSTPLSIEWSDHACNRGPNWLTRTENSPPIDPIFLQMMRHYDTTIASLRQDLQQATLRIEQLQRYELRRIKKQITEVLNTSRSHYPTLTTWLTSLCVDWELHVEPVLENELMNGIQRLLQPIFESARERTVLLPFQAFSERKHVIYTHYEDGGWRIMTRDDFQGFMHRLSRKFLARFVEWTQQNRDLMDADDSLRERYFVYMSKLNRSGTQEDRIGQQLRAWMYSCLAEPLTVLV